MCHFYGTYLLRDRCDGIRWVRSIGGHYGNPLLMCVGSLVGGAEWLPLGSWVHCGRRREHGRDTAEGTAKGPCGWHSKRTSRQAGTRRIPSETLERTETD